MKFWIRLLLVLVGIGLVGVGVQYYRIRSARSAAERALTSEQWPEARRLLRRYLWLHSGDARAHLMLAQAYASDPLVSPKESFDGALAQLQHIGDESELAAEARLREARLWFAQALQPAKAERVARRAIELDCNSKDAHRLLWQILDMTNRSDYVEPAFWRVYELSDDDERPLVLRQWFLSQFAPGTANEPLDRALGFLAPTESPDFAVEYRRLARFREVEPDSPIVHASVASWFCRESDPHTALNILREAAKLPRALDDRFFLATLVHTYVDLGEFQNAQDYLDRWPEPRAGFDIRYLQGILLQEFRRDYVRAARQYELALDDWPGPVVWRVRFRWAQCLERIGESEEAERQRRRAAELQSLLSIENHQRLRKALTDLSDLESLEQVAQFYESIGRPREASCWRDVAKRAAAN